MAEKFKIQTLGPPKAIPNKKDPSNPWKSWGLQFEGDPAWYDTFWLAKEDPVEGQELEGTKSVDEKWGPKFEIARQGGKGSWNPTGANATVILAAVHMVNGWLTLDPKNKKDWEAKRKESEVPMVHYIRTVSEIAGMVKGEVIKMGGTVTEVKGSETKATPVQTSTPESGMPPELESYPPADGEQEVDLGPM